MESYALIRRCELLALVRSTANVQIFLLISSVYGLRVYHYTVEFLSNSYLAVAKSSQSASV